EARPRRHELRSRRAPGLRPGRRPRPLPELLGPRSRPLPARRTRDCLRRAGARARAGGRHVRCLSVRARRRVHGAAHLRGRARAARLGGRPRGRPTRSEAQSSVPSEVHQPRRTPPGSFVRFRRVRWTQTFIPTLRDVPADAEAVSHKLLVRAGLIRQLMAGSYSILPLGWRVCRKIERVIREEMGGIRGQGVLLPTVQPAELWQRSGRWELIGEELFRLVDRKRADLCLGMTHEELFASLAAEIRSYRALPQIW